MQKNVLAIPNGSLFEATIELLKMVGLEIQTNGRSFKANISGNDFFDQVVIVRPQDIPLLVSKKVADCGICGWDCVVESGVNGFVKLAELNYSRKTNQPVRVVVFGKGQQLVDEPEIKVTTEYPNLSSTIFRKAKVFFSYGSTEAKVATGLFDFGIGVTETGESLIQNGLQILKTILVSPTVFIANTSQKNERFYRQFASRLKQQSLVFTK